VKTYGAMLEAVEVVIGTMSRYRLIETIYLSRDATGSYLALQTSIASVYKEILIFLCKAKKYFSQNTAGMLKTSMISGLPFDTQTVRVLSSLVQLDRDFSSLTQDIAAQDTSMEKLRPLLDAEMSQNILTKIEVSVNDRKIMKETLTDVECSMKAMSSTLRDIEDGMQSKTAGIFGRLF
jgi:hypothetical protein